MKSLRQASFGLLLAISTVAAHMGCSDGGDSIVSAPDGGQPDGGVTTVASGVLAITSPVDGELATPGDTIDVSVHILGTTASPTLLVDGVDTGAKWTADPQDPATLHTPFTIAPATSAPLTFQVTAAGDPPAFATLRVLKSVDEASGTAPATVTLASNGAAVNAPVGSLPPGTKIGLSNYPAATIPGFGDDLLSDIYRVHLSAEPSDIMNALSIDIPISTMAMATLAPRQFQSITLDVYEGDDPDDEAPPLSIEGQLAVQLDGSGVFHADLPNDAFHHTGSSTSLVGVRGSKYPFEMTTAQLCGDTCVDLVRGTGTPPKASLTCGDPTTASVKLNATLSWVNSPPTLTDPLKTVTPTSEFNSLRALPCSKSQKAPLCQHGWTYRAHEGNDFAGAEGTAIYAMGTGTADAVMNKEFYYVDVRFDAPSTKWSTRYLHVSDFVGFSQPFAQGAPLGKDANKTPIVAPLAGTYTLSCTTRSVPDNSGPISQLVCHAHFVGTNMYGANDVAGDIEYIDSGTWTQHVDATTVVAKLGSTARNRHYPAHLHAELHYKDGGDKPIDLAWFLPKVAAWSRVNGTASPLQSPTLRVAADFSPVMNSQNTYKGLLAGVDGKTLQLAPPASLQCPYGAGPLSTTGNPYAVTKMTGPTENGGKLQVSWDFGPCLYKSVCANQPTDVKVRLGSTAWRATGSDDKSLYEVGNSRVWQYLDRYPAFASGTYTSAPTLDITHGVIDADAWTGVLTPARLPSAADLEGANISLPAINGVTSSLSIMTLKNVQQLTSITDWQIKHLNEAGSFSYNSYPNSSKNYPKNVAVFTFLDPTTNSGTPGFPQTVAGHFIADYGGSNFIVAWYDDSRKLQWAWNISGDSIDGVRREFQLRYDSTQAQGSRYSFVEFNDSGMVWSQTNSWPVSGVTVVLGNKVPYQLPDAQ